MRGIAIETSRSTNSHIRAPRRVTATPTGIPARTLKLAIDLRARRTFGRCPEITPSCSVAASSTEVVCFASPTPMFTVTFSRRGTCIAIAVAEPGR